MKKVLEYHNDNDPFFQTIEPENEPDNKRKNRALDPVHPTWLRLVEDVRTWWVQHIYSQEGIVLELQLKHLFELVSSKEKLTA